METINGIDFSVVAEDAIAAAKAATNDEAVWKSLKDIIKTITDSLNTAVQVIAERKISGEFSEDDAAALIDDRKMVARIKLRSIAIISLQLAEDIWNAIADVFRTAIDKAIGWTIL